MGLVLPLILLVFHAARSRTPGAPWVRPVLARLLVPLVVVYVLAAAWNPNFAPTRADWQRRMTEMKDEHAIPGRKPSGPWDDNYYLASRGTTYHGMIRHAALGTDYIWLVRTGESFYSRFGGWRVVHPDWIFVTAGWLAVNALALTLVATVVFRAALRWETVIALFTAPVLIGMSLFGSMYQSLHFDFQPQGRYLFGALVGVFFLTFGTLPVERGVYRWAHATLLAVLLGLSYYSLWTFGAAEQILRDGPWFS